MAQTGPYRLVWYGTGSNRAKPDGSVRFGAVRVQFDTVQHVFFLLVVGGNFFDFFKVGTDRYGTIPYRAEIDMGLGIDS